MPGAKQEKHWMMMVVIVHLEVWLEVATLAQSGPEWEAGGELLKMEEARWPPPLARQCSTKHVNTLRLRICHFFVQIFILHFSEIIIMLCDTPFIFANLFQVFNFLQYLIGKWKQASNRQSGDSCTRKGLSNSQISDFERVDWMSDFWSEIFGQYFKTNTFLGGASLYNIVNSHISEEFQTFMN